jgi:hypothetical protein
VQNTRLLHPEKKDFRSRANLNSSQPKNFGIAAQKPLRAKVAGARDP